jgi:hypothetical protein
MRWGYSQVVAGLVVVMATGCGSGKTIGNVTAPPASVDFAKQIQPIFDRNCALSGCHAADTASGSMILDAGVSYANIVNVTSSEVAPEKRVAPGDSASSFLYEKLTQAQPRSGGQMPLGSNPLPGDQIALIKAWIVQGAKP